MKYIFLLMPVLLFSFPRKQNSKKNNTPQNTGTVKISFVNTVKGKLLELNKGIYMNPFGEAYSVSKFKYYISRVALQKDTVLFFEPESYHLVDESNTDALHFSFDFVAGNYNYDQLHFTVGVDSLHNVSGAQTGALDPLNDMFWTWNTGYVMAKLEGHSPQAQVVNNKFEFHIGGYMGDNNVLKNITLTLPPGKTITIQPGKTCEIIIEADIDKWWQQQADIKISEYPVCSTPGPLAKKIADNYSKMFSIKNIIYQTN